MSRKQLSLDELVKEYKKWFSSFGLTEENIRNYYPLWAEQIKDEGAVSDYAWHLFNLLLNQNEKQTADHRQFHNYKASILQRMLDFERKYEGGKLNEILQLVELERMHEYELSPFDIEVEISSGECCPWCDALNGKRYSIEEYRNEQPLGSASCTNENGCNCKTVSIPVIGANGDLVMNK